jgi:nitrite reductase/ring-hydroxylating ferredoxin subunit
MAIQTENAMAGQRRSLRTPYSGYRMGALPAEDAELTHVERGSPGGEYLRRFWHPVAMSSELKDLPLAVRMFGEDLVLFRTTEGTVGLLDRHCAHRGTSLEFGVPTECGLRCCYHGWLFAVDGTILETPGDPPESMLRHRLFQGAYPVAEYRGLIFGYVGPPELIPPFPVYDSYDAPESRLVPYNIHYPCNWLQVHENVMDPVHTVFLHHRVSFAQFRADVWGELPVMEFFETPAGMVYVATRRWQDKIWVRSNDILLPNIGQIGHPFEDAQQEKAFNPVAITRWTVPIDDTNCKVIGWRHFGAETNPRGIANEAEVGKEMVDFYGQTDHRSYEQKQKEPGDFDAQTSQRPIAVHALEHLTECDRGVIMLRRMLRSEIRKVAAGDVPYVPPPRFDGVTASYCHDSVVAIPPLEGAADRELLRRVGRAMTAIVSRGSHQNEPDRVERIRAMIADLPRSLAADSTTYDAALAQPVQVS